MAKEKIVTLYNCSETKQVILSDAKRIVKDKKVVGVDGKVRSYLDSLGAIEVSEEQEEELRAIYPFLGSLDEQTEWKAKLAARKSGKTMQADANDKIKSEVEAMKAENAEMKAQIAELLAATKK